MGTHCNSGNQQKAFNWPMLSMCCFLLALLSACNARDDSFRSASPPNEDPTPVEDGAGLVTPNPSSQWLPVGLSLSTDEETAISASFSVVGQPTENVPYNIVSPPENGTLVHLDNSPLFTYTPSRDFFGVDSFDYGVVGGTSATVTVQVTNVNDAPSLFADILRVVEEGSSYTAALTAIDPDGDALLFEGVNLPSWLSLNPQTGELSGVPTAFDLGPNRNIGFVVSDPTGLRSEVSDLLIEVIAPNDAPIINVDQFPETLDAGQAIQVNLFPDDPNGDPVAIAFESNEFLDISVVGGTIDVIAAEVDAVTQVNMVLLITDIRGGVTRSTVPFTLHPVNATGRGRTLYGRGAQGAGVHLVVLGDGYREDQQPQFRQHVEALVEKMQGDVGMQTHFSAWNVHMVETPSVDSGIDDNMAVDIRDTVFGTGYFCQSVRRLICGDRPSIFGVAIDEYPNFDQILVLVNDSRYGGGGSKNIAISSTESIEIALHEMGHTIAGLADEYVDLYLPEDSVPVYVEGNYANVSNTNDPALVPWHHWLGESEVATVEVNPDVGIFEGAYYQANGFYRPTADSLMRSYDGDLGPVNSEQWALSVYSRASPILDISPVSRVLEVAAGETQEFSVEPMFDSSLQSVEWRLDSRVIPDSGSIEPMVSLSFPPGQYNVSVSVRDISGLIRKAEPHSGVFNWDWDVFVK